MTTTQSEQKTTDELQTQEDISRFDVGIVGGGLAGILMAFKLSASCNRQAQNILLVDENLSLGGRYFLSTASSPLSGLGFEAYSADVLETFLRHIVSHLDEAEKNELDIFLEGCESFVENHQNALSLKSLPTTYVIKKEMTSAAALLATSSEVLTKKEAEGLKSFLHLGDDQVSKEGVHADARLTLKNTPLWKNLGKPTQDALLPVLEAVCGRSVLDVNPYKVAFLVKNFLFKSKPTPPCFLRAQGFEHFLEGLLRKRGVEVRLGSRVVSVEGDFPRPAQVTLIDVRAREGGVQRVEMFCKQVIFTIPPIQTAPLLTRQMYAPDQSKFLSQVQPLSQVCCEIVSLKSCLSEVFSSYKAGDCFLFPTERVCAQCTGDGRVVFYTLLSYESSLEAPQVREAIARIRRAVSRLLTPENAVWYKTKTAAPYSRPEGMFEERIVHMPVVHPYPFEFVPKFELKHNKMSYPGFFLGGDSFFTLGDSFFAATVNSVRNIAGQI